MVDYGLPILFFFQIERERKRERDGDVPQSLYFMNDEFV